MKLTLNDGKTVVEYKGELDIYNRPHGRGICWFADGQRYEGEFFEGKRHGKGIYSYPDGALYSGRYQNNVRHGEGVFVYPNNDIDVGIWEDGVLVTKKFDPGTYIDSPSLIYLVKVTRREHGITT